VIDSGFVLPQPPQSAVDHNDTGSASWRCARDHPLLWGAVCSVGSKVSGGGEAEMLVPSPFGVEGGGGSVFGAAAGVEAPLPAFAVQHSVVIQTQEGTVVDVG